jgi:hypothetical protein
MASAVLGSSPEQLRIRPPVAPVSPLSIRLPDGDGSAAAHSTIKSNPAHEAAAPDFNYGLVRSSNGRLLPAALTEAWPTLFSLDA